MQLLLHDGTGSTLLSNMNVPLATRHPTTNKFLGKTVFNTMADNEKGMAGSTFANGDITARVDKAPVVVDPATTAITVGTDADSGNMTMA